MAKVIAATPAHNDQEHLPMIVSNIPQIPDRSRAIMDGNDGPLPPLLGALRMLEAAGAEILVMPCNSAHRWFEELQHHTSIPLIHIADAVKHRMAEVGAGRMGLMSTRGTRLAGIYQDRFGVAADQLVLADEEAQRFIDSAIVKVKAGQDGRRDAERGMECLLAKGAEQVVLACSELPLALLDSPLGPHCLDATDALARRCVAVAYAQTGLRDA